MLRRTQQPRGANSQQKLGEAAEQSSLQSSLLRVHLGPCEPNLPGAARLRGRFGIWPSRPRPWSEREGSSEEETWERLGEQGAAGCRRPGGGGRLARSGEENAEIYYANAQFRVASCSLGMVLFKVVLLL